MNDISITIMASKKREVWARDLSSKLNNCPIAFDPHPRFNIGNIWENCKRAWKLQDRSKKWSIVIQDDAILCDNFLEKASKHLEKAEELGCAVQFYLGNIPQYEQQFKENIKNGYLVKKELIWGVAIAVKTELIDEMLQFGDARGGWQDDIKIKYFLLKKQIPTYYPIWGLVDHRQDDENPSLVRSGEGSRFSNFFIGNK